MNARVTAVALGALRAGAEGRCSGGALQRRGVVVLVKRQNNNTKRLLFHPGARAPTNN